MAVSLCPDRALEKYRSSFRALSRFEHVFHHSRDCRRKFYYFLLPTGIDGGMAAARRNGTAAWRSSGKSRRTDFISVGNFPVFNVADSSISLGVAVLVIAVLVQEVKERRSKPDAEEIFAEEPLSSEEPRV